MEAFLIVAVTIFTIARVGFVITTLIVKDVWNVSKYQYVNAWFTSQLMTSLFCPNFWECLYRRKIDFMLIAQIVGTAVICGIFYLVGYQSLAEYVLYLSILDLVLLIPIVKSKIATQQNSVSF